MVSKKYIMEAINKSIQKCWTISHMKEKLSSYSREEKTELLQGRLSPLEWEDYNNELNYYLDEINKWNERIASGKIPEEKLPLMSEIFKRIEEDINEALFKYDRRIIEKYVVPDNPIPVIDEKMYVHDEDVPYTDETRWSRDTIGSIEQQQINLQEDHTYFTEKESSWLSGYFLSDYIFIKNRINGNIDVLYDVMDEYDVEEMNMQFPNIKKHMDNAIDKTDGLVQPTILYHAGPVDISLVPGMHGTFKSYTSTSFQEQVSKQFAKEKGGYWEMVIYAPAGTKGVCGNGYHYYDGTTIGQLNQYTWEHEYLLGRDTGYTVVDIDYENHVQVVVLDDP